MLRRLLLLVAGALFSYPLLTLIVIDNNLTEDEVVSLLQAIKRKYPKLYCIVLVDTLTEQRRVLSAGADGVLLRDTLSENLLSTLKDTGVPDPQIHDEEA